MDCNKKILIAPLDWGLGHSTRCIPIIRGLLAQGHEVVIAASGKSALLLQENFPTLSILNLDGYHITYPKNSKWFAIHLLAQIPKILKAIRKEHKWLQEQQKIHHFDAIISDNRYGLHHKNISNTILTHQVAILSGKGRLVDNILLKLHSGMLQKFRFCWAVDLPGTHNLSGVLAHPEKLPENLTYIGLLSQFDDITTDMQEVPKQIVVLLSGPEPLRSQLEHILWQQAIALSQYQFIFVAGNAGGTAPGRMPDHIQYFNQLSAVPLLTILTKSALIICRSGYSTLMDMVILQKRALLIPTPGQTEQEYLATSLGKNNTYCTTTQKAVNLKEQIPKALKTKPLFSLQNDPLLLKNAIRRLLA